MWKIVNRGKKKRRGINEEIKKNEWKEHFMRLSGGIEISMVRGNGEEGGRVVEKEPDRGRVKRATRKLKNGKTAGADRIPGEV